MISQILKYNPFPSDLISYSDYYPFGMPMPGRKSGSQPYRFSFQGQEKDDEIKGQGNSLNYEYRMHDPRIGRFFAVDPLAAKYPYNSTYAFSENRVIDGIELEGLEFTESINEFNKNYPELANKSLGSIFSNTADGLIYSLSSFGYQAGSTEYFSYLNEPYQSPSELWSKGIPTAIGYSQASGFFPDKAYEFTDPVQNQVRFYGGLVDLAGGFSLIGEASTFVKYGLSTSYDLAGSMKNLFGLVSTTANPTFGLSLGGNFLKRNTSQAGSNIFKIGPYNKLKGTEIGLDAHHVGQSAAMKKFIPDYDPYTAPSILVPKQGHTFGIDVLSRKTSGFKSARDVLARDIFELRRVYPDMPNGTLEGLIKLNKETYPNSFIK